MHLEGFFSFMDSDLYYLLVLTLCIFMSAVFSAAETALTTIPESQIRKIIEEKKGFIAAFKLWLSRPNRVLTAIIVGNNLVNTLAAVVATVFAQKVFGHYVISIATSAVTIALLVFGEITPKTFARHNAKAALSWIIYLIYAIYFLLWPATWVFSHFAVYLIHLIGGRTKSIGPVATEDDIAYLIRISHEEGVFKPEQGLMLQSVMAFRDTAAREIMVPRTQLFSLPIDISFNDLVSQVTQHGFTRWPVYSEDVDHILGIFYVKDLINFQLSGGKDFHLKEHLRKALFIPESMKLDAVLRDLQRKKLHLAIVVDEYGGTAGIVSLEDILEEIVGEIRDEYDKEEEEETIRKIGDHHFLADGRASISDIQKICRINIPSEDAYDTLGGYLITVFGKIPKINEEYLFDDWHFRVIEVEEKRIVKVDIMKKISQT
jgi:putative hemolysin